MRTIEANHAQLSADVDVLAARIAEVFPKLEPDARCAAVTLYRLLAKGNPVSTEELARGARLSVERVTELLAGWSGVFYEEEKIIGFWGLTPRPFSKHLLKSRGRTLYGWCAWDTLFIPELIGSTGEVESTDPETGQVVRMTVSPDGVNAVVPEGAVMSILEPTEAMRADVVASFCHYGYFFPSRKIGEKWVAKNPGTMLMSIEDAFELAKRRNRGQFKEALDSPTE